MLSTVKVGEITGNHLGKYLQSGKLSTTVSILRCLFHLGQYSDPPHISSLWLLFYQECVNKRHISKSRFSLPFSEILVISLGVTGHSFEAW